MQTRRKAKKKSRKKVFKKTEIQNKFLKRKKKIPQKSIPPFGHVGDFLSFYLSIIVRFVFQNCFAFMPCQVIMGKNPGAPGLQMLHLYSLARVVFAYTRFPWFRNGMCAQQKRQILVHATVPASCHHEHMACKISRNICFTRRAR